MAPWMWFVVCCQGVFENRYAGRPFIRSGHHSKSPRNDHVA